jgi:antitoxin CptB
MLPSGQTETDEARRKRLLMRAWRRGTKEMDLILGPYADVHVKDMDEAALRAFDALLNEADTDLLPWIMGQTATPDAQAALIVKIGTFARTRFV